jgi:Protein of unknown function (DUF3102)
MEKVELMEAAHFDYLVLDKDQQAKLRYCAGEIKKQKASVAASLMEIGQMLSIAHEQLANHNGGTFQKWVESECGFSKRTAYNYMAAFNVFGRCATVAQLEDGAMYALAQNGTPEKALKEVLKLTEKGVKITQKQAKEIIKKHKEQVEQHETGEAEEEIEEEPVNPPLPPTKEEQMKAERKKAKSYAEYLMRSIDDLNRIKRNAAHPELIKLCGQIINGLERW